MNVLLCPSRRPRSPLSRSGLRAVAAGLLVIAGCSGDSVAQATRPVAPTAVTAPLGVDADGNVVTLEVVDGGPIGELLTDHRGFAVYGNSTETPDALTCLDAECTEVWVPLSPQPNDRISSRLDADEYAVIERPDGTEQVVYRDVALYLWSGDREIAIASGAGVAGIWFALTADGTRIGN